MKLAICNGSPRGKSSNSLRLIKWITEELSADEYSIYQLNKVKEQTQVARQLTEADKLLFVFPLYVDSMPGIVKEFFETLENQKSNLTGNDIVFIIHSGFPEMKQSRSLERYLEYFSTDVMGLHYLGSLIVGGSEALQVAPDGMFKRKILLLKRVIDNLKEGTPLPVELNNQMNKREQLSAVQIFFYKINPFKHFYWYMRARKHKFSVDLKARPYL